MTIRFLSIIILVLVQTSIVFAHGDEPRLEISTERVNPGGVVDVRGVDFEREEVVTLMLVNAQTAIPFGEVLADVEGVFLLNLTLPVDLPAGTYNFLAITDDHNITSPELVVQGAPITGEEGGGQGLRDEDDPLLAPMPTYPPGFIPGGVLIPTPTVSAPAGIAGANLNTPAAAVILVLVAVLVFVAIRMGRHRRSDKD